MCRPCASTPHPSGDPDGTGRNHGIDFAGESRGISAKIAFRNDFLDPRERGSIPAPISIAHCDILDASARNLLESVPVCVSSRNREPPLRPLGQ